MKKNDVYSLQSIYEASFLMARKCKLVGKEESGSKTNLLFENTTKTQLESMNYYNGGMVEGRKLFDCYRTIKDYIFNNRINK